MHQAITEKEHEIPLTHVVCPSCTKLANANHARAVGDDKINMTMGYVLLCDQCQKGSLLIYGGHPPLLDLDVNRFLIVWKMPEV